MTSELLLVAFIFLIIAVGCLLYLLIPTFGAIAELRAEIARIGKQQDRNSERLDVLEQTKPEPQSAAKRTYNGKRQKRRRLSNDERYEMIEDMLKSGKKEAEVVAATGVSKSTVYRIHKRMKERLFKQWLKERDVQTDTKADDVLEPFRDDSEPKPTEGGEE